MSSRHLPTEGSQQSYPQSAALRIDLVDIARGVALIAMTSFHFGWDLEMFGYVDRGFASQIAMVWYARLIASSFLFLVGVSFVLAHHGGFRPKAFIKRLAMVGGAAACISIATYLATPDIYIFFGILHHITVASVLALLAIGLPVWLILCFSVLFGFGQFFISADFFNASWLVWTGLNTVAPRSSDFVPLFPFFAAVLIGLAVGKWLVNSGNHIRLAKWQSQTRVAGWLGFIGRNSLIYYLLHQPVLIAILFCFQWLISSR